MSKSFSTALSADSSRPTLSASIPAGTRTDTSISAGSEGWSLAGNHQAELSGSPIAPHSAFGGVPRGDLAVQVAGVPGVGHRHCELGAGGDLGRRLDLQLHPTLLVEARRGAVHPDLADRQAEVQVEALQALGGPGADHGGPAQRRLGRVPADRDLVLGHVVTAVAGLRIVRVAEPGLAAGRVGHRRSRRSRSRRRSPGPGHPERRGQDDQQHQRHHHGEDVRHPVRLVRGQRWRRSLGDRCPLWRAPARVNARHEPASAGSGPGARPRRRP